MSLPQEGTTIWTYVLSSSAVAGIITGIVVNRIGKWFDRTDVAASKEYVDKEIKDAVLSLKEDLSRINTQVDKLDQKKADWRSFEDLKATVLRVDSKADDILKAVSIQKSRVKQNA